MKFVYFIEVNIPLSNKSITNNSFLFINSLNPKQKQKLGINLKIFIRHFEYFIKSSSFFKFFSESEPALLSSFGA